MGNKVGNKVGKPLDSADAYVDGHLSRTAFISLIILTFITFVGNFTQLQLSSALPTIVKEFHISVTTGQWLTSVFQLVMGVMVPLTAYLTRRFTTRQIVITSMLVFTAGSVLAWLGPTFVIVLLGRILEAIGTGVMWPVLQITVFSIYPLSRRGFAMGTVGMAMSVAPAIGPVIGGWQTDANGWRSIFMTLTVIGVASVLLAFFGLHNFGATDRNTKADFFSVSLSIFGFGGLMFGFTNIEAHAFTHPLVWVPILVGIAGIIWFVMRQIHMAAAYRAWERVENANAQSKTGVTVAGATAGMNGRADARNSGRTASAAVSGESARVPSGFPAPRPALLNLGVLRNTSFTVGTICAALSFFAFSSIMVIIPLYIQNDRGYSATMSGLIMLPGAIGQCIAQFCGGRLLDRFGARPVALVGSATLLIGTIMMSMIGTDTWIWWVSISQFTRQIGMGLVLMPVTTWSLNCLARQEVSAGSAVTNTVRQIAGAIGAPVMVITMETLTRVFHAGGLNATLANIDGVKWTLRISACFVLAQLLLVMFGVHGRGAGSAREAAQYAIKRMRSHGSAEN
ncbi:MFS transporter [Bifidobacterium thermophilum]|uniref:Multidrug efflux MFS transporter n=1 Tax=Bifidobacterium thermophilum TaxID=33905 RepID=A0A7X9NSV2_9BIFI|nr:multidrug efflux MFS transporter [Bifidobacterium thermophilum]